MLYTYLYNMNGRVNLLDLPTLFLSTVLYLFLYLCRLVAKWYRRIRPIMYLCTYILYVIHKYGTQFNTHYLYVYSGLSGTVAMGPDQVPQCPCLLENKMSATDHRGCPVHHGACRCTRCVLLPAILQSPGAHCPMHSHSDHCNVIEKSLCKEELALECTAHLVWLSVVCTCVRSKIIKSIAIIYKCTIRMIFDQHNCFFI